MSDPKLTALAKECLTPSAITAICDVGDKLGQGGFAIVRNGRMKATGEHVAVKVILPKAYSTLQQRMAALHEILVLKRVSQLGHGNVLKFMSAHEDISPTTGLPRLTIVTELCGGGELFDAIVAAGHYSEQNASILTRKLADALQTVHKAGVIHRDLKPENILLRSKDAVTEPVLADFGLAKLAGEIETAPGVVGTYSYLSPEIITRKLYTEASDVWALGVLTYILVCGYPPFYADGNDTRPLFTAICRGQFEFHDDAWHDVSAEAKHLIARMLAVDPKKRATIPEVLAHPWIVQQTALPVLHRFKTVSNLRSFNARRRLRAAAKAVVWGAGHFHAVRDLESLLGGKSIGQEELTRISAAFHKVAHTRNTVTLPEFSDVLSSLGYGDLPLPRLFAVFDVDESGDVDYREFIAGLAAIRREDEEALRICFRVFDADNDGSVSREELIQLLASTGFDPAAESGAAAPAPAPAAAAASAAASAASSSPAKGAAAAPVAPADPEEEAIAAAAAEANASEAFGHNARPLDTAYLARLEGVFAKIDANKDGKLSFEEFLAAVKADKALAAAIWHPLKKIHAN